MNPIKMNVGIIFEGSDVRFEEMLTIKNAKSTPNPIIALPINCEKRK